jgi:hypothetical protein
MDMGDDREDKRMTAGKSTRGNVRSRSNARATAARTKALSQGRDLQRCEVFYGPVVTRPFLAS